MSTESVVEIIECGCDDKGVPFVTFDCDGWEVVARATMDLTRQCGAMLYEQARVTFDAVEIDGRIRSAILTSVRSLGQLGLPGAAR